MKLDRLSRAHDSLQPSSDSVVVVPLRSYSSIQLGYAVTTHKLQGDTVENGYVLLGGPMQDRQLSYVQLSRARSNAYLYVDRFNAGEDLCRYVELDPTPAADLGRTRLARQMERSREKNLAHDLVQAIIRPESRDTSTEHTRNSFSNDR